MSQKRIYIKGIIIYFVSVCLLVLLDQYTKMSAVLHLKNKQPFVIIKNVFELHYLENTGTAWGMMSGAINLFIIITIVVMIIVTFIVFRMPAEKKYIPMRIMTILICAGAIGNFIDRIRFGYVVDFFYFKLIDFPIFNVADCYVTISMILMIIFILFVYKEEDMKFIWSNHKKNEVNNEQ